MNRYQKIIPFVFSLLIVICHSPLAHSYEEVGDEVYLTVEEAGPDYAIQGEYQGVIGEKLKLGAQVIARGQGKFDAVLYKGGLPGAGWDGKVKVPLKGETADGKSNFKGINFQGTIDGEIFQGTAEDGVPFSLEKVERKSPTLGAKPPEGAIVLFDGSNVDAWNNAKLEEGNLLGVGVKTKQKFKDYKLHLEFKLPYMPTERGQGRGNSGMYLSDQYECQVLDSFGLNGENNECGGFYKIRKPNVNMCYPPLTWQTYDVDFQAAKFNEEGKKIADAVVTIRHNGVIIHDQFKLPRITPGGGQMDEKPGALFLQDHHDPVRYRNIWIVEK